MKITNVVTSVTHEYEFTEWKRSDLIKTKQKLLTRRETCTARGISQFKKEKNNRKKEDDFELVTFQNHPVV
ncbi:hypothetical protein OUZ56_019267 [Daphnia magna]|uniref:Uncharacterized protein n=1 Tax=Daphnia magna TaxID=35525 RepID=A0ABQ9ZC65_9CRUS|nr:hypothetical protein OUZ56_019267 [Daphnia magna]